ncbi:MAG: MarR family transcriptional regulator [Longimicrobiales bacterium]|nr:MarR family transcriptional regulator [Longimicrobiales bacterium]
MPPFPRRWPRARWRRWGVPSTYRRGESSIPRGRVRTATGPANPEGERALSTRSSQAAERVSGGEGEGEDGLASRTWSDEEERALRTWTSLARCYTTFAQAVGSRISDYGLTSPQFGVLEALHHLGSLSLGDLAEKLLVSGGNITYVMDRLEERGLVERERSDQDRRVVKACLTPEGRELIAEVFPDHAAYVRELMDALDPSEEEQLRLLLKKLGKTVASRDA